jgi:glycosyltransferase involved in cell wall biosynthesis
MPAATVAMPAYNAATCIKTAIESVLAQTVSDFELLIFNDGSRDQTKAVVERLAESDGRVVLAGDTANHGVGAARKTLSEKARGEYALWLDADDWIEPDALESLLSAAMEKDAGMVCFGEVKHGPGGWTRRSYHSPDNVGMAVKHVIKRSGVSLRPFVKASLLRRCEFLPLNFGEDMALAAQCLMYAEEGKAVGLPRFLYHYEYNPLSICHAPGRQARNRKDLIEALEWTGAFLMERGRADLAEFAFREKPLQLSRPQRL